MSTIPPRQRATLARRIAVGLPVWAAARGSNLPAEEVGELMGEPAFRELIGAWAEILDMDPAARKQRLLKLAAMVIEQKLADGCDRTAFFVQCQYRRNRDPAATLAKGLAQRVDVERARAQFHNQLRHPGPAAPDPAPPFLGAAPSPVELGIAQASEATKQHRAVDPVDAAMWRKAGQLRHEMFGEQVLHHAVVRKAEFDRLMGPPSAVSWSEPEPADPPEPEARAATAEPEPMPPPNEPDLRSITEPGHKSGSEPDDESDEAFAARATAMFNATLAQAPPQIRELLATFSQQELSALIGSVWPPDEPDEHRAAQPLGP